MSAPPPPAGGKEEAPPPGLRVSFLLCLLCPDWGGGGGAGLCSPGPPAADLILPSLGLQDVQPQVRRGNEPILRPSFAWAEDLQEFSCAHTLPGVRCELPDVALSFRLSPPRAPSRPGPGLVLRPG